MGSIFRITASFLICSMELRELEFKLKSASVSKARAEQIAEHEAMKLETKVYPFLLTRPSSLHLNANKFVFFVRLLSYIIAAAKNLNKMTFSQ